MERRIQAVFAAMVALQALHSIEEYAGRFYEVFPPARALGERAPGLAAPGFAAFNGLLFALGLLSYFRWVRPARAGARTVLWLWTAGEFYNGVAHVVWAVLARGYNPGLLTAWPFIPLAGYLGWLLRARPDVRAAKRRA